MPNHTPQTPAYPLPDGQAISKAADEALTAYSAAVAQLGHVMAVVTAAAVRDILTGCDHDAPFDAGMGVHGMNEWTPYLDDNNRDIWFPLVETMPDRDGRPAYRIDLAKAAALPLD